MKRDWLSRRLGLDLVQAGFAILCVCGICRAQESEFDFSVRDGEAHFTLPPHSTIYYLLEESFDLEQFTPAEISLGSPGPQWQIPASNAHAFFFVTPVSIFSPRASLGDGIDDVFKLNHGLNPLDPALGASDSGFRGAGGSALSWADYYHQQFGRPASVSESFGREYSVFNSAAPTAGFEAISREVSLYNGDALPPVLVLREAYSREVGVFNFGSSSLGQEAVSREVSVFYTLGVPTASAVIASREVSIFNGQDAPRSFIQEAFSREVAVFNGGEPSAASEALSREVSIFNDILN